MNKYFKAITNLEVMGILFPTKELGVDKDGKEYFIVNGNIVYPNSSEKEQIFLKMKELVKIANVEKEKISLNVQRNEELKIGVVVSDVFMNEDIIKTMSVNYDMALADEVIDWIDINNKTVTFNKFDFGVLIKSGSQKVKEIYFKYRALKDDLIAV